METDEKLPNTGEETTEIAPALFKEFLDNQAKELELKSREIDLQKQKDDHAFEFAKTALKTQINDRTQQRSFFLRTKRNGYVFAVIIAFFFIALLITALAMDKDQIALEIIKATIFIVTGGAGGYAIGRLRKISSADSSETKETENK